MIGQSQDNGRDWPEMHGNTRKYAEKSACIRGVSNVQQGHLIRVHSRVFPAPNSGHFRCQGIHGQLHRADWQSRIPTRFEQSAQVYRGAKP